jgi:superfamily II RNA helicase
MTSPYLKVIEPNQPCDDLPMGDLATTFPFPLDPFQKHAIKAIHEGHNVLVTAKTGSGKTMVGEYLIHHCLKKGQRVFYTTPIKSLSNQKFHDLKQIFPSVGIMTGDIKYRPDAQVLIMTTEILRNLLYKDGSVTQNIGLTGQITLEGLGGVVFDEVHYINDRERGKVWEETMILLKPEIQQVLLSATIDHPELFASWLADLKQKEVHLLSTSYRIVPLSHHVLIGCGSGTQPLRGPGANLQPQLLMDNKEVFYEEAYKRWLDWRSAKGKEKDDKKRMVDNRRAGGYQDPTVKGFGGLPSFHHQLNECVRYLHDKELMPALFFVFSRAGCERYAKLIEGSVITSSEAAAIQHIWDFHLHKHKDILEHLPQAHQLLDLCKRGIAYHHSGLLPMLREMVEILFGRGLIKCLFATETFAVGINMPTKTVVFLDLEKYSDECQGLRPLRTDEYIQMAGRAGRRGKDDKGYVFYLPQRDPISLGEAKMMFTGKKSTIQSQMDFGYDFILKTMQAKSLKWVDLMDKSYWSQQRAVEKKACEAKIRDLHNKIVNCGLNESELETCRVRDEAENWFKTGGNQARKEAQKVLEKLKNKQFGPSWEKMWKTWLQRKENLLKETEEKEYLEQLSQESESLLQPRFALLKRWGFLDENNAPTPLGTLATEINEGHQILMARAYDEKICEALSQAEFVAFLAAFLNEGKDKDEDPTVDDLKIPMTVKDLLYDVDEWAAEYQSQEDKALGPQRDGSWNLKTTWIEPLYKWTNGESAATLCQEYGIYEGNLMRSILKVANMVEEWTNLATYTQNIEMLRLLEGLREKLVRDVAKPESLYLNLSN